MTHCLNIDRVPVHPDRYGSTRPMPPRLVVIHTTEGAEGDTSAENLAAYLTRPGDRTTERGTTYGSSYHDVADTDLRVIPAVEHDHVAFAAPGANTDGLHIVIPGKAGQTYLEWLAGSTRSAITTVAAYLLDARDTYDIPIRRLGVDEVRAGERGYCDHGVISRTYKQSTHWDVGPGFPWDTLAADIARLDTPTPTPPEEDDMPAIQALYQPTKELMAAGLNKTFGLRADGGIRHLSGPDVLYAQSINIESFPIEGPEHYYQLDDNSQQGLH